MSDSFSFSGDIWLIPMRKPDLHFFFFFLSYKTCSSFLCLRLGLGAAIEEITLILLTFD